MRINLPPPSRKPIKIPKQWKYWCKKAGLKIYSRKYPMSCIRDKERNYRILNIGIGTMESSCLHKDFHRWSNSTHNYLFGIPDTEKKWIKTIGFLREESVDSHNNLRRERSDE